MTTYTIDLNGSRYELNESFRDSLKRRAELEYSENQTFSAWWSVAKPPSPEQPNYNKAIKQWEDNIHDEGDPILTIETDGVMVPWDKLDQLEADIPEEHPDDQNDTSKDIFGRSHFSLTPHRFEEVPSPHGEDPDKIPEKPEEVDENMLVLWVPRHPDVTHTWGAGESMIPMSSWVEWNVQKRADQPQPSKEKDNSHDRFESLCKMHDCEKVGEYSPNNSIPDESSGTVERKGEEAFDNGRFGGGHWNV